MHRSAVATVEKSACAARACGRRSQQDDSTEQELVLKKKGAFRPAACVCECEHRRCSVGAPSHRGSIKGQRVCRVKCNVCVCYQDQSNMLPSCAYNRSTHTARPLLFVSYWKPRYLGPYNVSAWGPLLPLTRDLGTSQPL
jgi:hypothetical protein